MANMNLGLGFGDAQASQQFQRQSFGIADMSIVINLLTKLYGRPKQTITQEYISNARDANRESGSKRPIEIDVPTHFNPILSIRDFGPSLSPERIENVFLLYGASTKRTDDNQAGGFGIGAKSAWAYVDSFTIVTFLNGIKRVYVAHKSNSNGNLDRISEEKTTEPNGTLIQIPVKPADVKDFKRAVLRTVFFWADAEKPILNNFDPADLVEYKEHQEKTKINDSFSLYRKLPSYVSGYNGISLLVIDGIPYEVKDGNLADALDKVYHRCRNYKVFNAKNGQFHIAPNREDLITDDHNKNLLKAISSKTHKDIDLFIQNKMTQANNIPDSIACYVELNKDFIHDAEYKGYAFYRNQIKPKAIDKAFVMYESHWSRRSQQHSMRKSESSYLSFNMYADKLYYIDDSIKDEKVTRLNYRIRKLWEKLATSRIAIVSDAKLIADLKAKPLSSVDISDYKIVRTQSKAAKVVKKQFCAHYYNHGRLNPTQIEVKDINSKQVYALLTDKRYDNRNSDDLIKYMNFIGQTFFFIAPGSLDNIKDNNNFVHIDEWVKTHVPENNLILNEIKERLFKDITTSIGNLLRCTDKIKNKTLSNLIKFLSTEHNNDKNWKTYSYTYSLPKEFKQHIEIHAEYKKLKEVLKDPKKYARNMEKTIPLAMTVGYLGLKQADLCDHIAKYINANYKGV